MTKFSLVKFCLFVVYTVEISTSQDIKITKCIKSPDTWKKVDKVIKECQEDVKLKIIKDAFQNINDEWDHSSSTSDYDHHAAWDFIHHAVDHHQETHHTPISDHQHKTHDYFVSATQEQHPSHPSINLHHSSFQEPYLHNSYPTTKEHYRNDPHHTSLHGDTSSKDIYYPNRDPVGFNHENDPSSYNPSTRDNFPSIHNSHVAAADNFDSVKEHHHHSIRDHRHPVDCDQPDQHHHLPKDESTIQFQPHNQFYSTHEHSGYPYQVERPDDNAHIESTKILEHALPSANQDTKKPIRIEHVKSDESMADNPVEHSQYIDFNDFRKKRDTHDNLEWIHPATVPYQDKRIAGCIMQCIYEKNHAVDKLGWPTLDGLVNFHSEGVNEHGYFMATLRAADYCLKGASAKYHVNRRSTPENGQTCDVAFDVFDCISDRITEYCSDHHLRYQQ